MTTKVDHTNQIQGQWHQTYPGALHRWNHRIGGSYLNKTDFNVVSDFERKGEDNTLGVKITLDSLVLSFFQAVTPDIAVGGMITKNLDSTVDGMGRIKFIDKGNNNTLVCSATAAGTMTTSCLRRVNNKLSVAGECIVTRNAPLSKPVVTVAAEYLLDRGGKFQLSAGNNGVIQAAIQDIVSKNLTLVWSGIFEPRLDIYRFGVGVQLS